MRKGTVKKVVINNIGLQEANVKKTLSNSGFIRFSLN
jgi:hypothetical protein